MGAGEFLNINFFTALFTLINTIILFVVLKHYLFAPVMNMIRERQREIDALYDAANKAKQKALDLQAEYAQKLSFANQTGERLVQAAVERGQQREEQILCRANAEAEAIRQKAQRDIALERKKAFCDAKNELAGLALDIAGKVIGHSLQKAEQGALVDRFIAQLGETQ